MLVFDQLKKDDPQLRAVTLLVLAGLSVLLAGLWWVQVVSARDYRANLETQSFRTVRIPAVRGKILDRNGNVLAENRPTYNLSMYLDELRQPFDAAYSKEEARARGELKRQQEALEKKLNRKLTKAEQRQFILTRTAKDALRQKVRWEVASNVVAQLSRHLQVPLTLDQKEFESHYLNSRVLPFPLLANLDATNIARFEEQNTSPLGVDLEVQSTRVYPHGTTAAHLLGHLKRDNDSKEGEESFFSYRLPDFRGIVGVEAAYDEQLRGMAGGKSVQVNSFGYRTAETVWIPAKPGQNVVLTLDLHIQQAAEKALPASRSTAVVMDVRSGDVLAMASFPTLDPNWYVRGLTLEENQRINSLQAEKNLATQENYPPGSVFKTVVALAALEKGLDVNKQIYAAPNPNRPGKAHYRLGNRIIKDTADPGYYDFKRALICSCNTYFITQGIQFIGPEPIVRLGQRLHMGERFGLNTSQDARGYLPSLEQIRSGWTDGNTANMSIGQDPILMTPLQVAVLTSAIANGGKVLYPRLVERTEPQDPLLGQPPMVKERGRVRDALGVSRRTLSILHEAMLADTEDKEGTGKAAVVPGMRICAKTGTAEVQDVHNKKTGLITWFASFAPYGAPRYAVVVMVEDGESGGKTCAPIAGKIYKAILEREQMAAPKPGTFAMARP